MTKKQEFSCQFCGVRVKKYPSQVRGKIFTCSKDCPARMIAIRSDNCTSHKERRVCEICQNNFFWRKDAGRFCSDECRSQWFSTHFVEEIDSRRGGVIEAKKYSAKRRSIYARGDQIDRYVLFEKYDWMCHLCDLPIDPHLRHPNQHAATIDHVIPISQGGEHVWENVRPAHAMCNFVKSSTV